jgi:hypothetical protein
VLPFAKRQPRTPSECDLVHTGEIEVVDERALRTTRPQIDTVTHPFVAVPTPQPRARVIHETRSVIVPPSPDSSTRIPASRPSRPTPIPPSSRRPPSPSPDSRVQFNPRGADRADSVRGYVRSEMRSETLLPPRMPARVRPPEPSVDDEDMTRLLGFRPSYIPAPASSRRPQAWAMAPVMTVEADARSTLQPRVMPPPPSTRTLGSDRGAHAVTATTPSSRAPDSLRPVAMSAATGSVLDTGPHEPPPTSITMRTFAVQGRPTATWAVALVALGVFVGIGSAVYGRGDAADAASAAAIWLAPGRTAAAGQPVQATDSFASPPPPPVVAVAPAVERPAERPSIEQHSEPGPSEPLAALMQAPAHGEHGEAAPKAASRPTFVAPGSSGSSHHSSFRAAQSQPREPAAAAPAAASPAQEPVPALAAAPGAASPPPPPASRSTSRSRSKKASDDDMQAASASDALARAQLEAALR